MALALPFTREAARPGNITNKNLPPQLYFFNDLERRFLQRSNQIVVTGADALNENIDNILECPVGSFMFNRAFGSRIKSILFEPMNDLTAYRLKISIVEAIEKWEPRVQVVLQTSSVIPYYDIHLYVAQVVYIILSNNQIVTYVRSLPTQVGQ
jgi:phage baseplate assembly protein W